MMRYNGRMKTRGHHAHHFFSYPISLHERIYALVVGPLAVVALLFLLYAYVPHLPAPGIVSDGTLMLALLYTTARLLIAYLLALVVAVPLALLVVSSPTIETLLLPVFDVLESVPILAIFPIILILFIQFGFFNGAAIFILFLSMLWNIVFALVGGLKLIPKDILYAAQVFGIRGLAYLRKITLPAIFPQFVMGSILAVAQGWNLIIVVEVLHTYIPGGTSAQDLFGIGSILVNAVAAQQTSVFLSAVAILIILIALINFFVWQKLLHWSQRFRFE